jgi:hypothetical protein
MAHWWLHTNYQHGVDGYVDSRFIMSGGNGRLILTVLEVAVNA